MDNHRVPLRISIALVAAACGASSDAFYVGNPAAPGKDWPDKYLPWLRSNQLIP